MGGERQEVNMAVSAHDTNTISDGFSWLVLYLLFMHAVI